MAPIAVDNPPEDWMPPAERRRLQKANGHAVDATSVDATPVDATVVDDAPVDDAPVDDAPVDDAPVDEAPVDDPVVGEIVPRDVVLLGPAYDAAKGHDICRRVAAGESLKQICSAGGQPELATVMGWLFLDEIEAFTGQYLNARSARLELMMDEVVAIADDLAAPAVAAQPQPPTQETNGADNDENKSPAPAELPAVPEKDRLAIAKLRIETRRWLIDKQLKATPGTDTEETGRLVPSEILFDGVGA